jgi:hypothetical protein
VIHLKKKGKSDINKNYLNNVVKDYMMILNTSIAHIDRSVQSLSKSDTKAFWKTSHKYSNKKDI